LPSYKFPFVFCHLSLPGVYCRLYAVKDENSTGFLHAPYPVRQYPGMLIVSEIIPAPKSAGGQQD